MICGVHTFCKEGEWLLTALDLVICSAPGGRRGGWGRVAHDLIILHCTDCTDDVTKLVCTPARGGT